LSAREEFRALAEAMIGSSMSDRDLDEFGGMLGINVDEPATWERLRDVGNLDPSHPDPGSGPFFVVDPVFQAIVDADPLVFDPVVLAARPPAIRMLVSTRAVEAQVDNGGWESVFYNGVEGLLPLAVEGYELLGLPGQASYVAEVIARGWTEPTDDDVDDDDDPVLTALLASWFALPDAEAARAAYIREHPEAFDRR
jgi:hypothetical protein